MTRFAPSLTTSRRLHDCTFLVSGYDTLEESASVYVFTQTWARLEAAKKSARDKNTGDNQAYTTKLGGMEFQIKPHGGDGVAFILSNDRFTVAIRPAEVDFNLSVSFRACVLWQYGVETARRMIWGALLQEMKPRPIPQEGEDKTPVWQKLSRADIAFDFYSPEFSSEICPEMLRRIVCHSSTKKQCIPKVLNEQGDEVDEVNCEIWERGVRTQTLTIGKGAPLEIQIYNKSDEITEKSGKKWMWKLWESVGHTPDALGRFSDVWRIECRFSREHLAERGIDSFDDFERERETMLSEALSTRRLCDPTGDSNRRRWPLHPMWAQALELSGKKQTFRPLGRQTERAGEVVVQEAIRDAEAALRRIMVLRDIDKEGILNMAMQIVGELDASEKHDDAMERYRERYKYVNCAR